MKKLLLLSILVLGCSKDDPLRLVEHGTINFNGAFYQNTTGKYEVPNCSEQTPVSVEYILEDSKGAIWMETSNISIQDKQIINTDDIQLPIGIYTVRDINLKATDGTETHRVPSKETLAFDFSAFVEVSTPFQVEILPEQETDVNAEVMCYTSDLLDLSGGISGGRIVDLATLYFEIPTGGCVNRVVIVSDGKTIIDYDIAGRGIRGAPILKDFDLMEVIAYNDDVILSQVDYTVYNPDGKLTYEDVVQFNVNCD